MNRFTFPGLRAGQIVEVDPETVFDYIHVHADGTTDGNETGRFIEARQQPQDADSSPP